jgi:hypothetical protein
MARRGLFRVLLAAGVLMNLAVIGLLATAKNDTQIPVSWQPYTSQFAGCSVSYPQGWKTKVINRHDVEEEVRFLCAPDTSLSMTNSTLSNTVMDVLKSGRASIRPQLEELHEVQVENLKGRFRLFKEAPAVKMKVGGDEALATSFEYHTWNGLMGKSMKGMVVSTWNSDAPVSLGFVCPQGRYDKMFAAFGTFLQSFKPGSGPSSEPKGLPIPTEPGG